MQLLTICPEKPKEIKEESLKKIEWRPTRKPLEKSLPGFQYIDTSIV